jgi:hypothetical protein
MSTLFSSCKDTTATTVHGCLHRENKSGTGTQRNVDEWSPEANPTTSKNTKLLDEGFQYLYFHFKDFFRHQIDELDGAFPVKIADIQTFRGFGSIQCHDAITLEWAREIVNKMGSGAFRSYEEDEVMQTMYKVGMWIADREPPNTTLLFYTIGKQNGLNTSKWRIISATPVKGNKGGHFVLVEIDEASYVAIQPPAKFYYYTRQLSFIFN